MPLPQFTATVEIVWSALSLMVYALSCVEFFLIGESGSGRVTVRAHTIAEVQHSH